MKSDTIYGRNKIARNQDFITCTTSYRAYSGQTTSLLELIHIVVGLESNLGHDGGGTRENLSFSSS